MSKRNEDPEEMALVGQNLPDEIMALMQSEDTGFEDIKEYITLPFLKIIQGQTGEELQDQVGPPGSVAAMPGPIPVIKKGETFELIPVFFWNSYHVWSDLKDKESPMFLESSLDPASDIAKKAKAEKVEDRNESYGPDGGWIKKYCHHFNFAALIFTDEVQGMAVTISFAKGEWSQGRRWMNQMFNTMKGSKRVPLYLQRWEFGTGLRDRGDKKWHGFDMMPAEEKIVTDVELANRLITQHKELKQAHADRRLAVAVDEETGDEVSNVDVDL